MLSSKSKTISIVHIIDRQPSELAEKLGIDPCTVEIYITRNKKSN